MTYLLHLSRVFVTRLANGDMVKYTYKTWQSRQVEAVSDENPLATGTVSITTWSRGKLGENGNEITVNVNRCCGRVLRMRSV